MADIAKHPLLNDEEEFEIARAARSGCETSKSRLITSNLRLVVATAKEYEPITSSRFMDIVQAGNLGLMKAVDRYDPDLGNKFSTYAVYWIKESIRNEVRAHSRTIRVSVSAQRKVQAARSALRQDPDNPELHEKLQALESRIPSTCSLDMSVNEDGKTLGEIYADPKAVDPAEAVGRDELLTELYEFMDQLDPRLRDIIQSRFGFNGDEPCSLNDIGDRFGVTRERIRQLQNRGFARLRELFRSREKIVFPTHEDFDDLPFGSPGIGETASP